MESNVKPENTKVPGRWRKVVEFLARRWLGAWLAGLLAVTLLLWPIVGNLLAKTLSEGWQVSGYYYDGVFLGLLFLLALVWLISTIIILVRREFLRCVIRVGLTLMFLFLVSIFVVVLFFSQPVSGWPLDTVYSPSRDKFYILAYDTFLDKEYYRIYSADSTRLNPVWKVELPAKELDDPWSEPLEGELRLIISGDEKLLVIAHGKDLTNAVLLEQRQLISERIEYDDENIKQKLAARTEAIRKLLKTHGRRGSKSGCE